MTTPRQLYELQELDLEITECQTAAASTETRLGDRSALDSLEQQIESQRSSVDDTRGQWESYEQNAESVRAKLKEMESKLYGGGVTNLRELEGFEKEAEFLRAQLKEQDDGLLNAMMALEEAQEKLQVLEQEFSTTQDSWNAEQAQLALDKDRLQKTLIELGARREGLASRVGGRELKLYEGLRASKGGTAVAKVERGLCRTCRLALPTHQLQRARSGRESVLCGSCGRILYVG